MPGPLRRLSAKRGGGCHFAPKQWVAYDLLEGAIHGVSSVSSASAYKEREDIWFEHPQHPPYIPSKLPMAQSSALKSFDPHAIHPFTNNNALQRYPPPAPPSKYPRPIPSSFDQYTAGTPAHTQAPRQSSSTPNTIHSPEPRRPIALANPQQPSNAVKPIFYTFSQDRSSPELEEILLRKKLTQALGPVALGLDVKHGYPSS